jgi:L-alanine-DL-glutamate epimerase-like enolase superfamily enzyme
MNIRKIRSYRMDMALSKPYTVAFDTTTEVENVFLEIELSNGIVGIGAACASEFVIAESTEDTVNNLQSDALQQFVGQDIRQFRQLIYNTKMLFPKHSASRTAVDLALHDAFGKYLNIPVVDFYGRKFHSLPTSVTIGIKNVADTLAEAQEYKNQGFKVLKVKTGLNLVEDIERCVKIREKYGDYFKVRVDANQGYTAQQTIDFIETTQYLNLELVEQPLPVGTEAEMKSLPANIRKYIACDESLKDAKSALELAMEPAACGIFNIKLMKCSGLLGAFEIATIANAAKIDLFWGCFDESIASIAAGLHAALACPNTRYLDLDGSLDLAEDAVKGGFIIEDGEMRPTDGPGFGFEKL